MTVELCMKEEKTELAELDKLNRLSLLLIYLFSPNLVLKLITHCNYNLIQDNVLNIVQCK